MAELMMRTKISLKIYIEEYEFLVSQLFITAS